VRQQNGVDNSNIINSITSIYKVNGISGMYPGSVPRVMRKALVGAITWLIFEKSTHGSIHK